jgi:capsular exopolysaccharide synthesis family protein
MRPQPKGLPPHDEAQFGDGEDGALDLSRYAAAIWRFRWMILGLSLLGLGGGFGLTRVVKPLYEAQASLQVPPIARGGVAASPLRPAPLLEGPGWVELAESWAVLDHVVREARLYLELDSPGDSAAFRGFAVREPFVPGAYRVRLAPSGRVILSRADGVDREVLEEVAAGDSLGARLGFLWVPGPLVAERSVGFRVRVPRDAAVQLAGDLSTSLPLNGALLRVSLRDEDPIATAATVNAVATRFVEVATLLKRERLTVVSEVLREQLENSRLDLANAETALESFKVRTITLPNDRGANPIASGLAETRDPVRDAFFGLRLERDELLRDRDAVQRGLQQATDSTQSIVVALGTIQTVRASPELMNSLDLLTTKRAEARQMRLVFSESHAPLLQLDREIASLENQTIPAQARALINNLNSSIAQFDDRIAASSREMQQIPARVTEENRLERNVDVAQMIFTELQSAYEQARLSELSAAPDVRVLDTAVPPTRPVRDRMIILIAGAGFGGLGLGLGLALLLDRFDRRLRYPNQVTHDLGLPILGALPLVRASRRGQPSADDADQLLEAVRGVRVALLYAHGTAGPFVTTVTSPGSGDGKSFVSRELAKSFVMSGRRTLLIDGDNRRGSLHRTLGTPRKPGLTDLLAGTATRGQVTLTIGDGGFDFIPGGSRRQNAPELLASPEMARLMMELRGEYQAVIFDSPPLGAGIDPLVLASLSGTLVMILRNGVTDRELAGARLGDIERLPIRVLGAVLNDVQSSGAYRYYSYLPGYRAEDEVETPSAGTRRVSGAPRV